MSIIRTLATGQFRLKWSLAYQFSEACRLDREWRIFEGEGVGRKLREAWPIALELRKGGEGKEGREGVVSYYLGGGRWEERREVGMEYWVGREG